MKKKQAFGLVEFLITLVLIGVISVMSLNVVDNKIKKEKESPTLNRQSIQVMKEELKREIKAEILQELSKNQTNPDEHSYNSNNW